MAIVCFIAAVVVFAVGVFHGHIGDLNLLYLGLLLLALGFVFAGGVVGWVRERVG